MKNYEIILCEEYLVPIPYKKGDINKDGIINIDDGMLLDKYLNAPRDLTDEEKDLMDINKDGLVNSNDSSELIKVMAGITLPTDSNVYRQELRVRFVAEIGSSSSTFSGKAIDPIFYTKIDGTHELTFELPKYYFDENTGEKVFNELTDLLVNKCKILLRFPDEGEDYYLVINERADEEKDGQFKYTYSCNDAFIEELSKTGYGLVFDDDVEGNGLADIHQLAGEILKDTDWKYDDKQTGFMGEYRTEVNYNTTQGRYDTVQIPHPVHPIEYIPELKRYCYKVDQKYKIDENSIYCYEDTEQVTSNTVQNILYNTRDFVSDDGWLRGSNETAFMSYRKEVEVEDEDGDGHREKEAKYYLRIPKNINNSILINATAVESNKVIKANKPYLFHVEYKDTWDDAPSNPSSTGIVKISIYDKNPIKRQSESGSHAIELDTRIEPRYSLFYPSSSEPVNQPFVGSFKLGGKNYSRYYTIKTTETIKNPYVLIEVNSKNKDVFIESIHLFELKTTSEEGEDGRSAEETYVEVLSKTPNTTIVDVLMDKDSETGMVTQKPIIDSTLKDYKICFPADVISAQTIRRTLYFYLKTEDSGRTPTYVNFKDFFRGTVEVVDSLAEVDIESIDISGLDEAGLRELQKKGFDTGGVSKNIYKLTNEDKYYQYYQLTKGGRTGGAWDLALLGNGTSNKRRTLIAEKSNRFNLLQELAELFKTWCIFETKIGENNELQKRVYFRENVINPNFSGFHAGVNLRSLERKVESDEIVTKMYVEDVESDFANDGFVTIRTSSLNPWGENYYYNFKYYGEQKLLSKEDVEKLEFDKKQLYSAVKGKNVEIYELNDKIINAKLEIKNLTYQIESLNYGIAAAIERIASINADLENSKISKPDKDQLEKNRQDNKNRQSEYEKERDRAFEARKKIEEEYNAWTGQVEKLQEEKKTLIKNFETSYAQFIKEGVWSDSTYSDNDTYFLDSQKVSLTSAMPKMSWNISAIDGSVLHELEDFKVKVGDQTILVDNEFFPSKEAKEHVFEVLISGIKEHLDDGTKNEIEIRNYLTRFEDLFQRISAATQTLELNEQTYNRAANFTADGHIDQSLLERSLLENASILANSSDNSYKLDQTGLHLQSLINPVKKLRIVADGIVLSDSLDDSGNEKWTTGISADGINADKITTGSLDTSLIRIYSDGQPSFVWNKLGINAYTPSNTSKNYSKIAVIGDDYSVTRKSLTLTDEDISVTGWVDKLKEQIGEYRIVSAYPEGGKGSTGFSPWFYPDYNGTNNRAMRFIDQMETILTNLDNNYEEKYPEYILICGGFNDKTMCLNDLDHDTNGIITGEKSFRWNVSRENMIPEETTGIKRLDLSSKTIGELSETNALNDYCSLVKNIELKNEENELYFLTDDNEIPDVNIWIYRDENDASFTTDDKDYLVLNGSAGGVHRNGNTWVKERSHAELISRIKEFDTKVRDWYSNKGQETPKIILVSTGRYLDKNDNSKSTIYSKTINNILLKHAYEIYQQVAKELEWKYYDISGIMRTPQGAENWKDISWTDGKENYITDSTGKTDNIRPSTEGNRKIAKLLSEILEKEFSEEASGGDIGNVLFLGDSYTRDYGCIKREKGAYLQEFDTGLYALKENRTKIDFLSGWPEKVAEKYELSSRQFIDLGIGSSAFMPGTNFKWNLYINQLRNFTSRIDLFSFPSIETMNFEDDISCHELGYSTGRWNYYYDYQNPTYDKLKDWDLNGWLDNLTHVVLGGGYNERIQIDSLPDWDNKPEPTMPPENTEINLIKEILKMKRALIFLQQQKMQKALEREIKEREITSDELDDFLEDFLEDFINNFKPLTLSYVALGYNLSLSSMNDGFKEINKIIRANWKSTDYLKTSFEGIDEPEINYITLEDAAKTCKFNFIDIAESWGYKKADLYVDDTIHPNAAGIAAIAEILVEDKRIFGRREYGVSEYDGDHFTRFDNFGLYTIRNPKKYSFNYTEAGGTFQTWFEGFSREECLRRIQEESLVSLTEKGFTLNVPGTQGGIKLGYQDLDKNNKYGLYITDKKGDLIVQLHNDANTNKISGWNISTDGLLHIGDSLDTKKKKVYSLSNKKRTNADTKEIALAIGEIENEMADTKNFSTASFKVMDDGSLLASEAIISGSGVFSGAIRAESGQIGAFSIKTDVPDVAGRFDNMICIGDSYAISGDKYSYGINQRGWPEELASMLGTKKLYKKGQGSSGFSTGVNKVTISDYAPTRIRSLLWISSNSTYYHPSPTEKKLVSYIKETGDNDGEVTRKIGEKMESIPKAVTGLTSNFYNPVKKTLYYKSSGGWSKFVFSSENKMTQDVFNAIKDNPIENAAIQGITKPSVQKYYYYEKIWLRGEKGKYQGFLIEDFFSVNNTSVNRHKIYFVPEKKKFYYYEGSAWKSENYENFVHNSTNENREIEIILTRTKSPDTPGNLPPEPMVMWYNSDDRAYWYQVPLSEKWVKAPAKVALEQVGRIDRIYSLPSGSGEGYFYYDNTAQKWDYQSGSTTNMSPLANDPDALQGTFSYYVHRYYTSSYLYAETVKISDHDCLQITQHYSPTNFLVDVNNPYVSKNKYFDVPISGYYFYYDTEAMKWLAATINSYEKVLPYIQNYTYLLKSLDTEIENKEEIKSIVVCGGYVDRLVSSGTIKDSPIPIKKGFLDFVEYALDKYPQAIIYIFFAPHNEGTSRDFLNDYFKEITYPAYKNAHQAIEVGKRDLTKLYDISTLWAHTPSKDMQEDKMHPSLLGSMKIASLMESFLINKTGVFYGQVVNDIESYRVSSGFSFQGVADQDVSFWAGYSGNYEPHEEGFDAKKASFYATYGGKIVAKQGMINGWRFCEDIENSNDPDFALPDDFKKEVYSGIYNFYEWDKDDISLKGRIDLVNIAPTKINFNTKNIPICEYSGDTPVKVSNHMDANISIEHFQVPYVKPTQTNSDMGYIEWDGKSKVWVPGIGFKGDDNLSVLYTIEGAIFLASRDGGIQRIG